MDSMEAYRYANVLTALAKCLETSEAKLTRRSSSYGDGPLSAKTHTSKMKVVMNVSAETSQTTIDRTGKRLIPSDITKAATKTPTTIDPPHHSSAAATIACVLALFQSVLSPGFSTS
jgi:hypothetical protein